MRNPGALVLYVAIAIYLLAFAPKAMRRIRFESTISVRCAPKAAFALVSDPNNWHRYVPDLTLSAPVPTPVNVGDLIHDRSAGRDVHLEGVERVIGYEPGVRFGTEMLTGGHHTTGVYEFAWTGGETQITYRCQTNLTLPEAWLGNGFRRGYIARKLRAARDAVMLRIKALLEAEAATVSV